MPAGPAWLRAEALPTALWFEFIVTLVTVHRNTFTRIIILCQIKYDVVSSVIIIKYLFYRLFLI